MAFPQKNFFFFLLILSWVYILSLACTSQLLVVHDAVNFQDLGRLVREQGWAAYLEGGPTREPLYPFLVSLAYGSGQALGVSHISILVIFQIAIIAISQFLLLKVLRRLRIRDTIAWLIVIYFGVSPAILNSALSGYSEIVTFPLVLGLALAFIDGAAAVLNDNFRRTAWAGAKLGIFYFLIAMAKGTYEYIFPVFTALSLAGLGFFILKRHYFLARRLGMFIIVAVFFFYVPLTGYKLLNKHYNGHFALTHRADQIIFNSASLRAQPITKDKIISGLASIPGQDFCTLLLTPEQCHFWTTGNLEGVGYTPEIVAVQKSLPHDEVQHFLTSQAKEQIFKHPLQFIILTAVDTVKLFFWETTHLGFVEYPDWIKNFFNAVWFQEFLRFALFGFSLAGFFYAAYFIITRRATSDPRIWILLPFLWLVTLHVGIYAVCSAVVPRHALAIAPIFLVLAAFFLENIMPKNKAGAV